MVGALNPIFIRHHFEDRFSSSPVSGFTFLCHLMQNELYLILKYVAILLFVFLQRMAYLRNVLNYGEWICYIAALIFVLPTCDCKLGQKLEVGAVALFFGWLNLILYFRR